MTPSEIVGHSFNLIVFGRWVGWNTFLAVIPVVLGYCFLAVARSTGAPEDRAARVLLAVILFLAWLAFVPNTCYLLTEWRHFFESVTGPSYGHIKLRLSVEGLFFLLYSGIGVLCFVLAIRPVERAFRTTRIVFPYFALPLFLVISLGVYLGLVLRLNSWDILARPQFVAASVARALNSHVVLGAVIVFGLLLWALYEALDIWVDGVYERWSRWRGGRSSPSPSAQPKRQSRKS